MICLKSIGYAVSCGYKIQLYLSREICVTSKLMREWNEYGGGSFKKQKSKIKKNKQNDWCYIENK